MSTSDLRDRCTSLVRDEWWQAAFDVLSELLRRDPGAVAVHQERVEIAFRTGDRLQLVSAYLSLAQALEHAGARENARLVYGRVLEHDPLNPAATAAVASLGATESPAHEPPPAAAEDTEFVDLGALIMEPEPERDSRMRVDQGEPESEEDVDFRETLEQFKQGIAENLELTDFQAHYDLGIAFKEMGLLDEAIAQFQKALRAPEGRLKSSEALGIAFFEKGRTGIAESVLTRAIEALAGADDEKIGLIYWLGRAHEAQGRAEEALRWYERALAVDITFLDLGERIQRLTVERVQ
jgi:tetratricopeptide (TPR) repeat protein